MLRTSDIQTLPAQGSGIYG